MFPATDSITAHRRARKLGSPPEFPVFDTSFVAQNLSGCNSPRIAMDEYIEHFHYLG